MTSIASRVVVRIALVAASLAWVGFVFTQTVGDPDRGERIATAVLADDAARAEIVAPITSAVMGTTGLPPENRPIVSAQVDALLRDPAGAQAFIDPFAGSYARLLGEDDPRPTEFDLAPLTDELVAGVPGLDAAALPSTRFEVPAVPLPRTELDWMADVRAAITIAVPWLALAAVVGVAVGFVVGDPRRVLRRVGLWAGFAGATWVIVPFVLTWVTRMWVSGADSVVAVAVEEAVGGLRVAASLLLAAGVVAVGASFMLFGRREPVGDATVARPARRPSPTAANRAPSSTEPATVGPGSSVASPTPTAGQSATIPNRRPVDPVGSLDAPDDADDPDHERDPLWEYYGA